MDYLEDLILAAHSGPWKCGNEYLPYHPSASHVPPDYRDGWNRCWLASKQADDLKLIRGRGVIEEHRAVLRALSDR